jgi:hypothetical protein
MPQLALGVQRITQCSLLTATFMSIVFDLSQVAAELAWLIAPLLKIATRRHRLVCLFIILACTSVSISLNVRAFVEHASTPFEMVMSYTWGILLPLLVLALVLVASAFVRLDGKAAAPTPPIA